jgi:predicted phosphate transport protein (TIGR00153 family)
MSKRLFGWFSPKRGENVLEMVEKHLELTQNAVTDLYKMVEASSENKSKDTKDLFESISQLEMRADDIRRKMVMELTKSEMFPEERDDLMELVRAVDWIADWSKEAGRILVTIPFEKAPKEMQLAASNMCKANVDCIIVLGKMIKTLPMNPRHALDLADEVEMLEEEIDELYSIAREHLANLNFPDFSNGALILLNMFLNAIETSADWGENTADIVRAIAVRR